jgi:hypothetical protein
MFAELLANIVSQNQLAFYSTHFFWYASMGCSEQYHGNKQNEQFLCCAIEEEQVSGSWDYKELY